MQFGGDATHRVPVLIAGAEEVVNDELGRPTGLKVGAGDGGQVTGIHEQILSNLKKNRRLVLRVNELGGYRRRHFTRPQNERRVDDVFRQISTSDLNQNRFKIAI